MKILQLNLIAFGPFTERRLDFSGGNEGLHVVYGPNEAGKSSALRALRHMLFGFPERSTDNFMYPYGKIRVGGALRHDDGSVLEFVRRKGRVNTLRDREDREPLDEPVLGRFLGNVDEDLFSTMFGIGHFDLVRGGEQIIRGGGNVGQALFAAGSGIADFQKVQTALQGEAEALYAPSASKRPINEAVIRLRADRKRIRETQLPGEEWERHDRALREAESARDRAAERLLQKQSERNRFERIAQALPLIGRRKELLEQWREYVSAVLLPEGFSQRRGDLLNGLQFAEKEALRAEKRLEEIAAALSDLEISVPVLENADLIEGLYMDLGSYQKALKDRIQLETRRNVLVGEAREILSGLRPDLSLEEVEGLRPKKTQIIHIRELGTRYERLETLRDNCRGEIPGLARSMEGIEARLAAMKPPVPTDDVERVLEGAVEAGALEEYHRAECEEIRVARSELKKDRTRQVRWGGNQDDLEAAPLPSAETIDAFESLLDHARKEQTGVRDRRGVLEAELLEIDGRIREIRMERDVPTEGDLREARMRRDRGWILIRRSLEEGDPAPEGTDGFVGAFPGADRLPDAYERSVSLADDTADRLRWEADRVAVMARLLSDRETRHVQMERVKQREEELAGEEAAALQRWARVWAPLRISPASPREMRGWLRDQEAVLERSAKIRERAARAETLGARIRGHRKALDRCLRALSEPPVDEGESLSDLIRRGRGFVQRQEGRRAQRARLLEERERRERELEEARSRAADMETDLLRWQEQWADAIRPLGLGPGSIPEQANAVIDELKTLFDKLKDADILKQRIRGIDRDAQAFRERAVRLFEGVSPETADLPVERIVTELNARLTRTREAQSGRLRLEKQQDQEREVLNEADARIDDIRSRLDALCREAGCTRYEDLVEAERRSSKRRELASALADVEDRLRALSVGASVEDFVAEVRDIEPDAVEVRMAALAEEIRTLEGEKERLIGTMGKERNELSKMDGSARAAELAEETQQILAGLSSLAGQYARLRIASTVLAQAIERYRERHQGPVLTRTSTLFARLTRGAFEGIRAEFDGQGEPVLVGVRAGGRETVRTEGMSDGTTDQLYLALRLASLETYVEQHGPMPFILDDILIQFDNDRAAASLTVLGELSKRTQVIFFTHHRHLVEMAERNLDASVLFLHELEVGGSR